MTSAIPSTGKITGLCAALAMTVAGCVSSPDPVYTQFHREAGSLTDLGTFGNATLNNRLVMTGERQYTFDLANRFAGEVESTVTFAFNSAQLDGAAQAVLRRQAGWIRQFPEVRFRVYGHTDAVGSNSYNKALGLRRAQSVVAFLSTQGISRSRRFLWRNTAVDRDTGPRTGEPSHSDRSQRLCRATSHRSGRQIRADHLSRLRCQRRAADSAIGRRDIDRNHDGIAG